MATTTKITLTKEQISEIALALRVKEDKIPTEISIIAISPEAGERNNMPKDMQSSFSPAVIIT
ncbi:hypothetical protein ACTJJ0_32645 [Chitinophaga sp. 22321]|uniref:Uncharacterized protein n=1 Tax=Chitinophaga hostae TaxID=2831022 RepID=A0ABS5JB20_9BACT|nr:hypothetical protein [Chitinophaga hostae]MBS0031787.1 hypothetical protein [Chitinophaga hostae]